MENWLEIERLVVEHVATHSILGLALAIVDGEEVVYARGFGTTSVEAGGQPVTPDTLFGIGSISKTLLATLIMRLVDIGTLDLDAPVVGYLTGFSFSDPELGRTVTLRHLLSHTSGLPSAGKDWGPPDRDALERFVWDQLATYAFVAEPGRVHLYSSTAICLAGYVAEVVTGRPYRDLINELVCAPLGMERTTFDHAVAMTHPLALPHEKIDDQLRVVHRFADNRSGDPSSFAFSTALDLANLAVVHLNAGHFRGQRFLSPGAVAAMQTPVVTIPKLGASHPFAHLNSGYGMGVQTGAYQGERVVRHGGISQSFNCFFELLPDRRRGFVALTNWSQGQELLELVIGLYDRLIDRQSRGVELVVPPTPLLDRADRARWARHDGTYLNAGAGRLVAIRLRDGEILLTENENQFLLTPRAPDHFTYVDGSNGTGLVSFLADENAPTEYLYLAGEPYRRVALDPSVATDPSAWAPYAGLYRDVTNLDPMSGLRIRYNGGELMLDDEGQDERCRPLNQTTFLSSWGMIEFIVRDDGEVSSLILGKATRYERVTTEDATQ
jgi:CubicO group peptidase (beta-lactamase class C family)